MRKPIFLTPEGLEKANVELAFLKSEKRKEISNRLKQIRITDGSDYDFEFLSAKEEQAFIEGKISNLEKMLSNATLILPGSSKEIAIGSTVTIQQEGFIEETFMIVGSVESNPRENFISNESPLGQSLLGHLPGEVIEVQTPSGSLKFNILDVI